MRKFFVLCMPNVHSDIKTSMPVIARDTQQAVKIAKGMGLRPYGVVVSKEVRA